MAKPGTDSILSKVSIEVVMFERATQNEMTVETNGCMGNSYSESVILCLFLLPDKL